MKLLYLDESGSTGTDLDNPQQPLFVLAGVCIDDTKWHKVDETFSKEKIKIYPDFEKFEIHANELFNTNKKSVFYNNDWKDNLAILEKIVDLISTLDIKVIYSFVNKKTYKKHFGNNIIVDPYLFAFASLYNTFNEDLAKKNNYGILFCDELLKMEKSLNFLYPKLKLNNKNIIEKTFYLNSKTNNFIQIADVCAFYINKFNCISYNLSTMDEFKKEHCISMYKKIYKILSHTKTIINLNDYDNYFI